MGMEEFFTREKANEGIRVPLYRPDGAETDHWLIVRGVDSDEFRLAESMTRRKTIREMAEMDSEKDREKAIMGAQTDSAAALIKAWSFDSPCTYESAREFLVNAPQIAGIIMDAITKRSFFFGKWQSGLEGSQNINSDSTSDQRDQNSPSEQA